MSAVRQSPSKAVAFDIDAVAFGDVLALERDLGVSHVLAQVLCRRGLADPAAARAFLAADEAYSPRAFRGLAAAVELALRHVSAGSVITVHGDYDCDGVCSTAILVSVLRLLGADVDWYLPDRASDGYGLSSATVERLATRGTKLLITADCAITAVEAVASARAAGMDVLVSDHHAPRGDGLLPDAPIVHPALCAYPCEQLCATAVAAKLAQALRAAAGLDDHERPEELELVAIATVADVVPLIGENRRLVRAGLRALASTARPGLRSLMRVAGVDPLRLDERALAFRLAPRINAAGRLQRADSALELLLTEDPERAAALAEELNHLNAERRHVETRIRFEAEAQVAACGPAAAYVLGGEDWHPGVIGIVAARIAERHHRPTVLIATADGASVGSARSIPAFDLLRALDASSALLTSHGGHRAAAGLKIATDRIDAFRAAFVEYAGRTLTPDDLMPRERVDALADGEDIGLSLCEELAELAPFGAGNPQVSLLLAAASLSAPTAFGGEGRSDHARFSVSSGRARAPAVAFGTGGRLPVEPGVPVDAAFRLERNEWQGVVEPRLVLRALAPSDPAPIQIVGAPADYLERAFLELDSDPTRRLRAPKGPQRHLRDRRGRGIAATITELVATTEPVLVVSAAPFERAQHLSGRLGGFDLCSYQALERDHAISAAYTHVVLLDPPSSEDQLARARAGRSAAFYHLAWGEPELRFALHIHGRELQLRDSLADCYRALRDGGGAAGEELEEALRGRAARSAELAGRMLRVLTELGLVVLDRERSAVRLNGTGRVALDQSPAYLAYQQRLQDGLRYLEPSKEQVA
jgi:single-stranded-DNA-specific exonuclease